jgi:hypothetical protein
MYQYGDAKLVKMMRSQKCGVIVRKSFRWLFRFFAAIAMLIPYQATNATSVLAVSLVDMVQKSAFVFEGKVVKIETRKAYLNQLIHTYVTFEVIEAIKGSIDADSITLSFLGGAIGDTNLAVSEMQLPKQGEHGIYFVESLDRPQVNPLFGWSQGHYLVEKDDTGKSRVLTNQRHSVIKIMGSAPGETVGFSKGVARGLTVSEKAAIRDAMSAKEFKDSLHMILEKTK